MRPISILLTLSVLLLASCNHNQTSTAETITVVDDYNRTVELPLHPQRIVSTSPAVTEILFALGADSLLVGRTDFCQYPPEAQNIPSIGGISNLSIEHILSLQPDLVISGSMVAKKASDQLASVGIPIVFVVEKPHFEALYSNISAIAHLVGLDKRADSLNTLLRNRVEALAPNATTPSHHTSATPKVYYVVGFGPSGNFTAGGNTFINDIIRLAGGRNIAEDIDGWSYSLEALIDQDPDYIIVRREDSASFVSMAPYNQMRAVREHHVIGINSATIDLQTPRNIDAILYLQLKVEN